MKVNPELFDHAAAEDMSADALLTHLQGQAWLFRVEHEDCLIPKRLLPGALPFTEDRDAAVAELVAREWWVEHPRAFEVVYDASTLVQSLHAQWAKRKKDQRAQAKARSKRTSTDDARDDTSDDTTAEAAPPQPTNQAINRQDEELELASADPRCAYCGVPSPARLLSESGIHRYGCSRQRVAAWSRVSPRGPEAYLHGDDGHSVVVIPCRIAALLVSHGGLGAYHQRHRGSDQELDNVLMALKNASAGWRSRVISDAGSGHAEEPEAAAPLLPMRTLSTGEVADRLGCTDRAVRLAIQDGRLAASMVGGRYLVSGEDVEHFRARRAAA